MSLLDDEEDLAMDTRLDDMMQRREALDVAWRNFVSNWLEIYQTKGLNNCSFLPKAGIIVPKDMNFSDRLSHYCSEHNIGLFHLDCDAYDKYYKKISEYSQVTKFYKRIEPFSIILIENINSLINRCDQTTINYLIHSWKNPFIERTGHPDIITEQHFVIFTIDEANTDKIGEFWSPSDSYAWYGNIMDKE